MMKYGIFVVGVVVLALSSVGVAEETQLSPAASLYILNVFSANSTFVVCSQAENRTTCELTESCYWNVGSDRSTNNTCMDRSTFFRLGEVQRAQKRSWCYEFFPLPFIAAIFFIAAFISGVSIVGMIYCYLYYDVFSKRLKTGEIVYNQYHFKTWPIVTCCAMLFGSCFCLAITAWVYWLNETICAYVVFTIIFIICLVVLVIGYPSYRAVLYFREKCGVQEETGIDLEEYIMPQTLQALPSRANQVRCF